MAAEMAALRPKEIGRLALVAPVGLWRDEAPVVDIFGMMPGELIPYLFHNQSCFAAQRMMMLTMLFSDKDDRSQEQVEILLAMSRGFRTVAKFLFPIPEHGLEKRLPRITAPTLIVWGANDRFAPPLYARIFADAIPGARLELIERAGHLLALEFTLKPVLAALGARHILDAQFVVDSQLVRHPTEGYVADDAVTARLERTLTPLAADEDHQEGAHPAVVPLRAVAPITPARVSAVC